MRLRVAAPLIVLLTLIAYAPSLGGGWLWDDDAHVTRNIVHRLPNPLRLIWTEPALVPQYYPLTHTVLYLEWLTFGDDARGYRAVNVLLHATNALLLGALLARLKFRAAWPAACVFALHPVAVETAAWVSEHKNTLSTLFYLLSAGAYLAGDDASPPRWRRLVATIVLFACALACKTTAATLPAALMVVVWWRDGRVGRGHLIRLAPMLLLGCGAIAGTTWVETHHVGANHYDFGLSPADRVVLAGRNVVHYATTLLRPTGLSFVYARGKVDASSPMQWCPTLLVMATLVGLAVGARRIGRGPLAGALIFVGTLVPALGFVDVYPFRFSWTADHFAYLALPAGVATACGIVARVAPPRAHPPIWFVAVAACLAITMTRARVFRDAESLWADAIIETPTAWLAMDGLAAIARADDPGVAREWYENSLVLQDHPEAHAGLAAVLWAEGDREGALAETSLAASTSPWSWQAIDQEAKVLDAMGRPADAAAARARAMTLLRDRVAARPGDLIGELALRKALLDAGRSDEAAAALEAAARRRPWLREVLGGGVE